MSITLQLQHSVSTRCAPTDRALDVAVMFGLSLDGSYEHTVIPPTELRLGPGQVVFVTGVSGGGKSTLLRLIEQAVGPRSSCDGSSPNNPPAVIRVDALPPLPDAALIDALSSPASVGWPGDAGPTLEMVCGWLSRAGLNDAAVMLRRPDELSAGQRDRLRIAQAMATAERSGAAWSVLLADEFGSTLDRTTAFALADSVARWSRSAGVCLIAATTHDDLLEPLAPDTLIEVGPGGVCDVHQRNPWHLSAI